MSFSEYPGAQDVIEVLVRQHDMRHDASGDLAHIVDDRTRFGERGTGVDEQRPGSTLHQTDRDVEKR